MKLIGLTGGPGCGKSAVLKIFETFASWRVFDADRICHEIYAEKNSAVAELIAARWGRDLIGADGTPDRVKIAQKVFGCENERAWLNSLMHPEIMRRIELGIDRCDCASFVMIDAPLLFESGWDKSVELVIAVWSSPAGPWIMHRRGSHPRCPRIKSWSLPTMASSTMLRLPFLKNNASNSEIN